MKKTLLTLTILSLMLSACGTDDETTSSNKEDVSPDRPSEIMDLDTPQ